MRDKMASAVEGMVVPLLFGEVTHVVDPSDFWLRMGSETDLANFHDFELMLDPALRQLCVGQTDNVMENNTVLVCCGKEDKPHITLWRRATVIRIDRHKNLFDVFYKDYGSTQIVPSTAVCQTVLTDIEQYPVNCYRCSLAGIQPIAKSWTSRAVKTFKKLVLEKSLKVALVSYDMCTMCHRVALYPCDEQGRSFTHILLEAENGLPTEESVQEYAQDVEPVSMEALYGYNTVYDQEESESSLDTLPGGLSPENPEDESFYSTRSVLSAASPEYKARSVGDDREKNSSCVPCSTDCAEDDRCESADSEAIRKRAEDDRCESADSEAVRERAMDTVVVPKLDLSRLLHRSSLTAGELQKRKEEAAQAERKARLQKDIIQCHRDLDEMNMSIGPSQTWGKSDLLFGRQISEETHGDLIDEETETYSTAEVGSHEERRDDSAFLVEETETYSTAEVDGHEVRRRDDDALLAYDRRAEGAGLPPVETNLKAAKGYTLGNAMPLKQPAEPCTYMENKSNYEVRSSTNAFKERVSLPSPPPSYRSAEEKEYYREKQFQQILREAVNGEEVDVICAEFYSLVSPDNEHAEEEVVHLVQFLMEEAIKSRELTDVALAVMSKYTSALTGLDLHKVLKACCEKFVKLPVAKMPRYHSPFAGVLVKLSFMALNWPQILRNVVQDFISLCIEKWAIFNNKGIQTGLIPQQLEGMYIDCLEVVLAGCVPSLRCDCPERLQFVMHEMKEKVLEGNVDHKIRSRLLTLLIKFGAPVLEPDADVCPPTPAHGQSLPPSLSSPTAQHPSPLPAHNLGKSRGREEGKRRRLLVDSSCQTTDCWMRQEAAGRGSRQDCAVQTHSAAEPWLTSKSSVSSTESGEDAQRSEGYSGASRNRRREAVMEYLKRKESDPSRGGGATQTQVSCRQTAGQLPGRTTPGGSEAGSSSGSTASEVGSAKSSSACHLSHSDTVGKTNCGESCNVSQSGVSSSQDSDEGNDEDAGADIETRSGQGEGQGGDCSHSHSTTASGSSAIVDNHSSTATGSSANSFLSAMSAASISAFKSIFRSKAPQSDSQAGCASVPRASESDAINSSFSVDADDTGCQTSPVDTGESFEGSSEMGLNRNEVELVPGGSVLGSRVLKETSVAQGSPTLTADVHGEQQSAGLCDNESDLNTPKVSIKKFGGQFYDPSVGLQVGSEEEDFNHSRKFQDASEDAEDSVTSVTTDGREEVSSEGTLPRLQQSPVHSQGRCEGPPALTQLSLRSIQDSMLSTGEGDSNASITHPADHRTEDFGKEASSKVALGASSHSHYVSVDKLFPEDDDESSSVPSDWEMRAFSPDSSFTTDSVPETVEAAAGGRVVERSFQEVGAAGDGFHHSHLPAPWPRGVKGEGAGDSELTTEQAGLVQRSSGRGTQEDLHPLSPKQMSSPVKGKEPCEQGDLARFSVEKPKGKKKTKYRPLHSQPAVAAAVPNARAMWQPREFICTNCGAQGHLRSDCTKPMKDLLFF